MANVLLFLIRYFVWLVMAAVLWLLLFPVVWTVSLPLILIIALFRKKPYWRAVVEMMATVHG